MDRLWQTLLDFLIDYCEYLPESIPVLEKFPAPNDFLFNHVCPNVPFILKCPEEERLPAVDLWNDHKYLRKLMKNKTVSVAVTPDGRADSIIDGRFMIPEERNMLFDEFYTHLHMPDVEQVFYLQKQNNNLIEEFSPLVNDVGTHVPLATEAFGYLPDAANIWIGDHRSVSSWHKDHYENIYYVITGMKQFTLYPPVAVGWMPYKKCKKFQWFLTNNERIIGLPREWIMNDMNEEVEWVLSSPKPDTPEQFTLYQNTKSYVIQIYPGEALYLPAMWYHEVSQTDKCIAVNYWYDMKFDMKYPFIKLFGNLCNLKISNKSAAVDTQSELQLSLLHDLHDKKYGTSNRKQT